MQESDKKNKLSKITFLVADRARIKNQLLAPNQFNVVKFWWCRVNTYNCAIFPKEAGNLFYRNTKFQFWIFEFNIINHGDSH